MEFRFEKSLFDTKLAIRFSALVESLLCYSIAKPQ